MQRQPLGFYQDNLLHPPLKVSLFSKLHQLQGVVEQLHNVTKLPKQERQVWLDDHEDKTAEMFHSFREQVKLNLDESDVDREMLDLLTEYSRSLKECAVLIQTLFPGMRLES
jgi:hypothetical protein